MDLGSFSEIPMQEEREIAVGLPPSPNALVVLKRRYLKKDDEGVVIEEVDLQHITPRPRPERTTGFTEFITTGCGTLYVTLNKDDLGFCEVFAQTGKTGGCASSQIESTGRLISLALRAGVKIDSIIKQITGIRCPSPVWRNGKQVLSCPDAIAKVLAGVSQVQEPASALPTMGACPDCGGAMEREGGCMYCKTCGSSRC